MDQLKWTKSSWSAASDCVEWALTPEADHVLVRDSKRPEVEPLKFTLGEWRAFVAGVLAGEATF